MRKILFATSALVGATALASSAMAGGTHVAEQAKPNAGALTVMVGGQIDFQTGFVDQDTAAGTPSRNEHFANDTEIHVQVSGSTDSFDYGAVVELNADIDADADADGGNADKAFIFVENDGFGRVEMGGNAGASDTLEVDASNIARATGGIDGDWYRYVNIAGAPITGTTAFGNFQPNLPVSNDDVNAADAQKITYYTPRFSGLQAGVSYTIDTLDVGTTSGLSNGNGTTSTSVALATLLGVAVTPIAAYENVFAGGLNYEGNINENTGIEVGVTGEMGEAQSAGFDDLAAWTAGAAVEFVGFSIAGSYSDLGDSGAVAGTTGGDQNFWTAGAGYENGPFGVSATYMDGEGSTTSSGAEFSNVVVGADYQLAPGFVPYVEASFFDLDSGTPGVTNDGNVILVGSELTF